MCLGFGWARSFVHCGEKVLTSKAVSRIMSLTLSEPVSSSIKGGNIYICAPQQYREDKRIKTMVYRSLHVWCEHQVRCSMLLFSHFLDKKIATEKAKKHRSKISLTILQGFYRERQFPLCHEVVKKAWVKWKLLGAGHQKPKVNQKWYPANSCFLWL